MKDLFLNAITKPPEVLINSFVCLCVCFFLHLSLLALFPPYSFIWHPRVVPYVLITNENLETYLTCWRQSSMNCSIMLEKISTSTKSFITICTFYRFWGCIVSRWGVTGVPHDMLFKHGFSKKAFATLVTHESEK